MYAAISLYTVLSVLVLFFFLSLLGLGFYNLYLHPYSKYPGPFLARASLFYSLWHAYKGDLHLDALICHERYGKYCVPSNVAQVQFI